MILDFYYPRQKHMLFTIKLKAFVLDLQDLNTEESGMPDNCDLGKWIYDIGMQLYKNLPEMQELEKMHVEFHTTVSQITDLKKQNKIQEALAEFDNLMLKSKEILNLLDVLENIINN